MLIVSILLLLTLLFLYVLQLISYGRAWRKISIYRSEKHVFEKKVWISVIIPARNEAKQIVRCLDSLSKQSLDTACFEIILVDDHSEDLTAELAVISGLKNLSVIRLSEYPETLHSTAPKKTAIDKGIQAAQGKWIVTTDADCIFSENWLSTILSYYLDHHPDMIVMPVSIEPACNVLNRFESLDFMTLQAVTAAGVSSRRLNMCNGANLSYSKQMFEFVGGFKDIDHIASGDDMLLMEKINRHGGDIQYLLSSEVIVKSFPTESLSAFMHQRRRWAGKSTSYADYKMKTTLLLVYMMNLLFFMLGIWMMMYALYTNEELCSWSIRSIAFLYSSILITKFIFEYIFLYPVADFYKKKNLFIELLIFQPIHIIYIVSTGFLGLWGKYEWKGRKLK